MSIPSLCSTSRFPSVSASMVAGRRAIIKRNSIDSVIFGVSVRGRIRATAGHGNGDSSDAHRSQDPSSIFSSRRLGTSRDVRRRPVGRAPIGVVVAVARVQSVPERHREPFRRPGRGFTSGRSTESVEVGPGTGKRKTSVSGNQCQRPGRSSGVTTTRTRR